MDELKELFEQLLENYYYAEGFCMQEGMSEYHKDSELEKAIKEYRDSFGNILKNLLDK